MWVQRVREPAEISPLSSDSALSSRTAPGSNVRSILVLPLETDSSGVEYTSSSAACQPRAYSAVSRFAGRT